MQVITATIVSFSLFFVVFEIRVNNPPLFSRDDHITSYAEFKVQKFSRRHEQSVRRLLCLTEACIVERDPATYAVVCATPLEQVTQLFSLYTLCVEIQIHFYFLFSLSFFYLVADDRAVSSSNL